MSIRSWTASAAFLGALALHAPEAHAQSLAITAPRQMFTARNFPGNRTFQSGYTPSGGRLARVLVGPFAGMGAGVLFGGLFGLAASYAIGGFVPCDVVCSAVAATVGFAVGWGVGMVFGVTWVGERYGGRGSWIGSTVGALVFGVGATALGVWASSTQQWGWLVPAALLPAVGASLGYEIESAWVTRPRPAGPQYYRYDVRVLPVVSPVYGGAVFGAAVLF